MALRHTAAILALAAAATLALPIPAAAFHAMSLGEGPTAGVQDLLPDITMAPIFDVSLEYMPSGKVRLRFGSIIRNVGDGPLEARGTGRVKRHMNEIRQVIHRQDGTTRTVTPPDVTSFYAGDGHNHWHISSFVVATLYPLAASANVGPNDVRSLRKIGFCLTDSMRVPPEVRPPNAAAVRAYPYTGCGNKKSQRFKMGISSGWADLYPASIAYQWIDVTGLPVGDYRLCTTPNPEAAWLERDYSNNSVWMDLHVSVGTKQISTVGQGAASCETAASAAVAAAGIPAGPAALALFCAIGSDAALDPRRNQL